MKDCLIAFTSSCQLVAIRFALCSAPRMVLRFHLCGMADFQCTCSFPGFWLSKIPFFFLDTDECASPETNECHLNALCTNTEGFYICRCLKGFQGDGRKCTGKSRKNNLFGFFSVSPKDLLQFFFQPLHLAVLHLVVQTLFVLKMLVSVNLVTRVTDTTVQVSAANTNVNSSIEQLF